MLEYTTQDNRISIKFPPLVDTAECEKFRDELIEKLGQASGEVVFDMGDVMFISSEFLRLCCVARQKAGAENFSVRRLNPMIYKVFKTAGLSELIHIS